MKAIQQDIDERTNLTSTNKFELLLFRLGIDSPLGKSELFGINVFKIREIVAMPSITPIAGAAPHSLGVVNLRGQVIPVLDLPSIVGCKPKTGLNIMLVTEYARTTQAFAVESVEDIVRLDWNQVLSADSSGAGHNLVTSIADSGPCTLRQAVIDASPGSTIRFANNIAGQTNVLAYTTAPIDVELTLTTVNTYTARINAGGDEPVEANCHTRL